MGSNGNVIGEALDEVLNFEQEGFTLASARVSLRRAGRFPLDELYWLSPVYRFLQGTRKD